jgi:hypothetical protein
VRHRSSASRSFVLAALWALHLDPSHAGGEIRSQEAEPADRDVPHDQNAHALFVMTPIAGVIVRLIAST